MSLKTEADSGKGIWEGKLIYTGTNLSGVELCNEDIDEANSAYEVALFCPLLQISHKASTRTHEE